MRLGPYIEITRGDKAEGRLPSLTVHRFYVVAARDRHAQRYVEIGAGQFHRPNMVLSKHHIRVTIGGWSVPAQCHVRDYWMDGGIGRIWFEAGLGRIRGLRERFSSDR